MPKESKAAPTAGVKREPVAVGDLSPEWINEINRRVDDIDSGRVESIPANVAHRWLQRRFPFLRTKVGRD